MELECVRRVLGLRRGWELGWFLGRTTFPSCFHPALSATRPISHGFAIPETPEFAGLQPEISLLHHLWR